MTNIDSSSEKLVNHRFLDEAGDTIFFGKGRIPIIGQQGVSLGFSIGMVKFSEELASLRTRVMELQRHVAEDRYLNVIPSVAKKIRNRGFFFHATDDPPEVREFFFKFIVCHFFYITKHETIRHFQTWSESGCCVDFLFSFVSLVLPHKPTKIRNLELPIHIRSQAELERIITRISLSYSWIHPGFSSRRHTKVGYGN